jgi:hypothetical protein
MKTLKLIFISVVGTTIILFGAYHIFPKVQKNIDRKIEYLLPCSYPITYNIDRLDAEFGIDRSELLGYLLSAERIWENVLNKNIFEYQELNPQININLIYDSRQSNTVHLKGLASTINEDKSGIDSIKKDYDNLKQKFNTDKSVYEKTLAAFKIDKQSFDSKVEYWNAKGGATSNVFTELKSQEAALQARLNKLLESERELESKVLYINTLGDKISKTVTELNNNVDYFNQTRTATGDEFDEGEYVEQNNNRVINIYQYDNEAKLIRVLAHEFGHSIGMQHNDDAESIMYQINKTESLQPSATDILELKNICRVK